ncbi:ATP-binding protein [bacterium]|nr:ATP-binding protein [bacterium]
MEREQIIETLLLWNFWEKDIDVGIRREDYLTRIKRYLDTDEIVTLTGVRRCGKSTLLLQVIAQLIKNKVNRTNTLYVNFEDPRFYNFLNIDLLDEIWQAYCDYLRPEGKVYLVLDEIQKITGWETWARSKYDRKEDVKIFVTGSNAELLSSEFANILTGRHLELSITPLSFAEFLRFKDMEIEPDRLWLVKNKNALKDFALEYLQLGGFPKIVLTKDELLRKELLSQYFTDIITRDIVNRHKVKDVGKLENLALFYSTNFTRTYSFNKIKKVIDFSVSLDSIHRFSHYLKDAFLIDFVPRFSYSLKDQMQTGRKVYFVDNGMHNAIAFKFSQDKGKLLENAVFHHLKRQKKEVYYFHEKQEVDFICKQGLEIVELINVCYTLGNKETLLRETSGLLEAMRYFKLKESKIIIAEGEGKKITAQGFDIQIIPFYQWALDYKDGAD